MARARHRQYIRKVRADLGMEPAWPPASHRRLGDVGVFRKGHFERKGTLESLYGIGFAPRPIPHNRASYHSDSTGNVQVHLDTGLGVDAGPVAADGSVLLEFARARSVLFHATGCRTEEIEGIETVESRMLDLHRAGGWPDDQVVITEVTHAAFTTVLMSRRRRDRIALRAAADPGVTGLDMLAASGGLQWAGGSTAGIQLLSEGDLTPLYRVRGVIPHWFKEAEAGFLGGTKDEDAVEKWVVDEVSSESFEDEDFEEDDFEDEDEEEDADGA
ncbi:hypothetical protein CW362_28670 [Streptomyces populi]|uniref:Uncharacterized protein n=1 Tax=Streptomyces populi TaxID=2058924 RepID=A0A2I0SI57_9ACTN|nr:hypothetical protein [Streptomyces populi]PKT69590.1 hypothetical protein CW362_28670 [Streptomyces populi]